MTIAPFKCKFCGLPSWVEPEDQEPPADYCHEADHGRDPDEVEEACVEEVKGMVAEHCERAYRAAWKEAMDAARFGYPGSPTVNDAWYRYKRENFS